MMLPDSRRLFRSLAFLLSSSLLARLPSAQDGSCSPSWLPTFGGLPGTDERVDAAAVFDDGSGPALYLAGGFQVAGGVQVNRIAKWNGEEWSPLGPGLSAEAFALQVFDDGGGPALYAAGLFLSAGGHPVKHVAKWDGSSWSALGSGMDRDTYALAVFDDGGGP